MELYVLEFLHQLLNSLKPKTSKTCFQSVIPFLLPRIYSTEHHTWSILTSESQELFSTNASSLWNLSKLQKNLSHLPQCHVGFESLIVKIGN